MQLRRLRALATLTERGTSNEEAEGQGREEMLGAMIQQGNIGQTPDWRQHAGNAIPAPPPTPRLSIGDNLGMLDQNISLLNKALIDLEARLSPVLEAEPVSDQGCGTAADSCPLRGALAIQSDRVRALVAHVERMHRQLAL